MMTIYVLSGFNNYYNRVIKKFDTLNEYEPYFMHTQENFNFVPNDNVNTQVVLGSNVNLYDGTGDYLLVVNDLNEITSRWFIIESVRDRAGQYTLTLHRDLVADHYNELLDTPMYIEKATLSDSDPFIFNNENLSFNQIKSGEYQIKDESDCAWLIGYLSRSTEGTEAYGPYNLSITSTLYNEQMTESEWQNLISEANRYTINNGFLFNFTMDYYRYTSTGRYKEPVTYYLDTKTMTWKSISYGNLSAQANPSLVMNYNHTPLMEKLQSLSQSVNLQIIETAKMSIPFIILGDINKFNEYLQLNGKIIKVGSNDTGYKYYKISAARKVGTTLSYTIKTDKSEIDNIPAIPTYMTNLVNEIKGINDVSGTFEGKIVDKSLYIDFNYEEITTVDINDFSIPATRRHLQDAPYDMFCIPYKEDGLDLHLNLIDNGEVVTKTLGKTEMMSFAQQLAENLGKNLLDIQLLPFCPLQSWSIDVEGRFDISETGMIENKDFTFEYVLENSRAIVVFYSTKSEGTINYEQLKIINSETGEKVIGALPTTETVKMSNQCDMYRLCSPNWNGQFEFTPARCGIDSWYQFNVDYTYLPYSPYIHINPNFSQLYGKDYDDARGLICQGDFSISYMSDAWVNYQVQNKNYANTFNRQIENMELKLGIERNQQVFNAITGTVMGGAGGAAMGAKAGPWGAVAGAAVGTVLSAAGGIADVAYGDLLRSEALDYTKDMFNYSIDNIKALPDSIAKVTAYTKNNRIFPVLEYYTCTDEEKKAFANKIAWNGMTVMRIGTLGEFINNNWSYNDIESKGYIKGKLIRLETINDDYHIVNALSGELDKGVYIKD